jgi:hypothetical protein
MLFKLVLKCKVINFFKKERKKFFYAEKMEKTDFFVFLQPKNIKKISIDCYLRSPESVGNFIRDNGLKNSGIAFSP